MGVSTPDGDRAAGVDPAHRLTALRERLTETPPADPAAWRSLARSLGVTPARLRETAAFHPDLTHRPEELRVCGGTSCTLRGADAVARALPGARRANCLGYCDRSPTVLDAAGGIRTGCDPGRVRDDLSRPAPPPGPPAIRCVAPEAIVTRRIASSDASSLESARRHGVYTSLASALQDLPEQVVGEVERSGERGRGGAGFPTGAKWRSAAASPGARKVVVANGDEGDPGSFVDRVLLESDPHAVLEGLALCAYAIGAHEGIVFVRSEYPAARARVRAAVEEAEAAGILGEHVLGSDFSFRVRVAQGFGSYVCGEETALLETLAGHPGEVRFRPPYPTESGLEGCPTVINNVETLVAVPWIVGFGGDAFRALGTAHSNGTKALSISAGFGAPGIVEIELGRSLRQVIEEDAATNPSDLAAVWLGGPMGSLLTPDAWDVPLCYGALAAAGVRLGHGGIVAVPKGADWRALLAHALHFMAEESCGRCVPCREGSRHLLASVRSGRADPDVMRADLDVIEATSLCAFGQGAPGPMRTLLDRIDESGDAP